MSNRLSLILSIILTFLFSWILGLFFVWWSIGIAGFLAGIILPQKPFSAFKSGFWGGFLEWFVFSIYIDIRNHQLLSERVSILLFDFNFPLIIILFTSVIGGITASLGAVMSSHINGLFRKKYLFLEVFKEED